MDFISEGTQLIELRWVGSQLQYRVRELMINSNTGLCGFGDWLPWSFVHNE